MSSSSQKTTPEAPASEAARRAHWGVAEATAEERKTPRATSLLAGALVLFVGVNVLVSSQFSYIAEEKAKALYQVASESPSGAPPQFDVSVGEKVVDFWKFIPDATTAPLTIISGMSQLHAINQYEDGDRIVPELLDASLSPDARAFGLTAPNMTHEELLVQLASLLSSPKTTPNHFIFALCFDKFRNIDLRSGYRNLLAVPQNRDVLRKLIDEYAARYPLATAQLRKDLDPTASEAAVPADATGTEAVEANLKGLAEATMPLVKYRQDVYSYVTFKLYEFRNWALNIKRNTPRPMLQGRLDMNKELLRLFIEVSQARGIHPIIYMVPQNPRSTPPYVEAEYQAFKVWAGSVAQEYRIPFADLDTLVPEGDWGLLDGEPDFAHFTGRGHKILADELLKRFGASLGKRE